MHGESHRDVTYREVEVEGRRARRAWRFERPGHLGALSAILLAAWALALVGGSAQAAVDLYGLGSLSWFEAMDDVNARVDAGNALCTQIASDIPAGFDPQCSEAKPIETGALAEAGVMLSAGGYAGVGVGYQYLKGSTASTVEARTDRKMGTFTQSYAPAAYGPIVKAFVGLPGPSWSARIYGAMGRYDASYVEKARLEGQFDHPLAVESTHSYSGKAEGREAGLELHAALGPQTSLVASAGYGWLVVPETFAEDGTTGPALDFTGLRLKGGINLSF